MIDQNINNNLKSLDNNVEKKENEYDKKNIEDSIIGKLVAIENRIKNAYSNNDDKGLVLRK